jgi:hypothetical protein
VSGSIIQGKRYPESQRTIVLQFGSPEEARAWEAAGSPFTLAWPDPVSDPATPSENEQHEGNDRQDDEDGPKHLRAVPRARRRQPA